MNNQANWIVIGRFGRPHGIKGFLTVHSFTEPRDNILRYTNWHAFLTNQWKPITLLCVETHSKAIIAKVEGYPDRELVTQLTNVEIAVQKSQLAQLDAGEYYWHQLVGTVVEILPTGANDVLIVQGEKKHFIPYLPGQFVIDIDNSQQVITVDWELDF